MRKPSNPLKPEFDDFDHMADEWFIALAGLINQYLSEGYSISVAVDRAMSNQEIGKKLRMAISDKAIALFSAQAPAVAIGYEKLSKRDWWLNHLWNGETTTLSQKITETTKAIPLKESLRVSMKQAKSWTETGRAIAKANFVRGDLPKYINSLEFHARRVMAGDPEAFKAYQKDLRAAERSLSRLSRHGAPTKRYKKAVANFVKKSQGTIEIALKKAVERLTTAKMRANSDRIARTEMAKAYGQGVYRELSVDGDVIGMRWTLSDRHPEADICNFHASVNQYGLGPGVYLLDKLPPYPAHPHCLCILSSVYQGNPVANQNAEIKTLKSFSEEDRKKILGVRGNNEFEANPQTWAANMNNFEGYKPVNELIEN